MIMKALTMPSHLAATTKIMISMTATSLRRKTATTTSTARDQTRRWRKLWSRTTTITVTIVAVLMITLVIRFIVIDLTGMATIFMAQGMGMPTLAIMAILIMVMSHTVIITRTNTVEKTTAICTNMGAKTTDWKSTCMHMTLVTWSNMCPCMSRISASCTGRTGT